MTSIKNNLSRYKVLLFILEIFFFMLVNPYNSTTIILAIGIGLIIYDYYLLISYISNKLCQTSNIFLSHKKRIVFSLTILGGVFVILESLGLLTIINGLVISALVAVGYSYAWYINSKQFN